MWKINPFPIAEQIGINWRTAKKYANRLDWNKAVRLFLENTRIIKTVNADFILNHRRRFRIDPPGNF